MRNSTIIGSDLFTFLDYSFFSLFHTTYGTYEDRAAADVARCIEQDSPATKKPQQDYPMAFTPSKDQKRRDREQKKLDKRIAREEARAEKLAAQQDAEDAAEQAAEEEAFSKTEAGIQAKLEADFEAELAAEAEGESSDS